MHPVYEKIAKAIRTNTLKNRFSTVPVIDKYGLIEFLSDHFKETDVLFNPVEFEKACDEIKEEGE